MTFRASLVPIILAVVCLTGCTATGSPGGGDSEPPLATSTPVPSDAAIALTCGGVAIIETNLQEARSNLADGSIDDTAWAFAVNSVALDYRGMQTFGTWGLRDELAEMNAFLANQEVLPSGASFDPDGREYSAQLESFRTACEDNATPIVVFARGG